MKIKAIIRSMRLRTLPLSLAGVLLGLLLALQSFSAGWPLIVMLLLTTASLQVLSNISNELGDFLHGVDNEQRGGPQYALQKGELTVEQLRKCVLFMEIFCYICGVAMILLSFGTLLEWEPAVLLLLGIAAVWAAKHYTLGKLPYGYMAMGDLFVFIFFGLVPVIGGYFVISHSLLQIEILLPAITLGLFSVAVLNVNNIRDMQTDKGKRITIPLLIGKSAAKVYQSLLIIIGWCCAIAFLVIKGGTYGYFCLLTAPLFLMHLRGVWQKNGSSLDPMLPMLVIATFCFSLLLGFGLLM